MRDPNRLRVAEAALRVAELTYDVTRRLPLDERAGLSLQMRRAAISIGSNITEGCGRSTDRQFLSFLQIAMARRASWSSSAEWRPASASPTSHD
jgi:four helix bundle protein